MGDINKNTGKQEISGLGGLGCGCAPYILTGAAILAIGAGGMNDWVAGLFAAGLFVLGIWLLIRDFKD